MATSEMTDLCELQILVKIGDTLLFRYMINQVYLLEC